MEITVNEARVRLGKLVEKVFTEDFKQTYEMMAPQLEKHTDEYIVRFLSPSDAFIKVAAENLANPASIELVNKFVYPPVVYCVGVRYHLLTMTLAKKNQSEKLAVPEPDKEFFIHMMIDYSPMVDG